MKVCTVKQSGRTARKSDYPIWKSVQWSRVAGQRGNQTSQYEGLYSEAEWQDSAVSRFFSVRLSLKMTQSKCSFHSSPSRSWPARRLSAEWGEWGGGKEWEAGAFSPAPPHSKESRHAGYHVLTSRFVKKLDTYPATFIWCIFQNINCAPEERSLHSRWNIFLDFHQVMAMATNSDQRKWRQIIFPRCRVAGDGDER